mmetsp:Transcript_12066/g.19624  ORF Transcript_12066/g.19624 Transcript_12066/m.19624 type:complete len:510 (-) Transcript_12066:236-1765(-)
MQSTVASTKVVVFKDYRGERHPDGVPRDCRRVAIGHSVELNEDRTAQFLPPHAGKITAFAWSPDGQWLVTAAAVAEPHCAQVWDVAALETVKALEYRDPFGCPRPARAAAFAPRGDLLALATEDYLISLWDGQSLDLIRLLEGHSNSVTALAWAPGGNLLLSASEDCRLILWPRTAVLEPARASAEGGHEYDAGFHPENPGWPVAEGRDFHVCECPAAVLDAAGGNQNTTPVSFVAWGPQGLKFCTGSNYNGVGELTFWDALKNRKLISFEQESEISSLDWNFQSKSVVVGYTNGKVKIWGTEHEYTQIAEMDSSHSKIGSILLVKWISQHRLVSCSDAGEIVIWNMAQRGGNKGKWIKAKAGAPAPTYRASLHSRQGSLAGLSFGGEEEKEWVGRPPALGRGASYNSNGLAAALLHPDGVDLVVGTETGDVALMRIGNPRESRVMWAGKPPGAEGGEESLLGAVLGTLKRRLLCPMELGGGGGGGGCGESPICGVSEEDVLLRTDQRG